MRNITHIIVHHTATARDTTHAPAINEYHRTKNWGTPAKPVYAKKSSLGSYIQYHYFIEANGKVTQCHRDEEIAWHAGNANTFSIGICLAGYFDKGHDAGPTTAQIDALRQLIIQYSAKYSIPRANIVPHRKYSSKSCYGRNLSDAWAGNLLEKTPEQKMTFVIRAGGVAVYLPYGSVAIPWATDYATFREEYPNVNEVVMSPAEFDSKYRIAKKVTIK